MKIKKKMIEKMKKKKKKPRLPKTRAIQ
jgi:hypothetical protein